MPYLHNQTISCINTHVHLKFLYLCPIPLETIFPCLTSPNKPVMYVLCSKSCWLQPLDCLLRVSLLHIQGSTHCLVVFSCIIQPFNYTPRNEVSGGILDSACLSVCPSVRLSVCPLTFSCPPCSIYSSWWILSIFGTNDQQHERVCRMWWPLTLTYIFKVIWPWLRKSCPLCSIYSSGWILFWCGTNDCYQ